MIAGTVRTALALATVLAATTCEFGGSDVTPILTEGNPPLAIVAPPAPRPPLSLASGVAHALGRAAALAPFFAALEAIDSGTASAPVVIIQLGDSHSASDILSGRLRDLFQHRFGAAGRGLLPAGVPYAYFHPDLVRVAETGAWQRASSFAAAGRFGIGGVIQQTAEAGARMTLTETEIAGFDRGFFEVLRQPGAGTLRLQIDDGEAHDFATQAAGIAPHWVEFNAPPHSHRLTLTAVGDGSVSVLAWGTQRQVPGVVPGIVYENLGIGGATVGVTGHWDPATVAGEFRRRDPALIIVAYGSNEGVAPAATLAHYAEHFSARVAALHAAAPGAAILVIGPPDVDRRGQNPGPGCDADWAPPPTLEIVRGAQRAVAEREGWYFWDWQAAMGGPCAADRWARQTPPLEFPDHVHQKAEGYRLSAEMLFADLINEYRRYRARSGAPQVGS